MWGLKQACYWRVYREFVGFAKERGNKQPHNRLKKKESRKEGNMNWNGKPLKVKRCQWGKEEGKGA